MMIVETEKHQITKSRCKYSTSCKSSTHWSISEKKETKQVLGVGFIGGATFNCFWVKVNTCSLLTITVVLYF
jgi:dissimilatory sulfite reductase (desulfoviridin) alpha/beta subunit